MQFTFSSQTTGMNELITPILDHYDVLPKSKTNRKTCFGKKGGLKKEVEKVFENLGFKLY